MYRRTDDILIATPRDDPYTAVTGLITSFSAYGCSYVCISSITAIELGL